MTNLSSFTMLTDATGADFQLDILKEIQHWTSISKRQYSRGELITPFLALYNNGERFLRIRCAPWENPQDRYLKLYEMFTIQLIDAPWDEALFFTEISNDRKEMCVFTQHGTVFSVMAIPYSLSDGLEFFEPKHAPGVEIIREDDMRPLTTSLAIVSEQFPLGSSLLQTDVVATVLAEHGHIITMADDPSEVSDDTDKAVPFKDDARILT